MTRELDENVGTDAKPEAPHSIYCQVCDRKLMGVSYPVAYRTETLDNLNLVHSSEEGAWCNYCRRVTVFVRLVVCPACATHSARRMLTSV